MKPGRKITDLTPEAERDRKRYAWRKRLGLCTQCGKYGQGQSLCPEHRAASLASLQTMREYRKQNGLCEECGDPAKGSRCADCNKIRNARPSRTTAYRRKEWRQRTARARKWRSAGLCGECGKLQVHGSTLCTHHKALSDARKR